MRWGRRRKGKRRVGRAKRLIKAFVAGVGLGAAAGLMTPPRSAKAPEPSVKDSENEASHGPPEK